MSGENTSVCELARLWRAADRVQRTLVGRKSQPASSRETTFQSHKTSRNHSKITSTACTPVASKRPVQSLQEISGALQKQCLLKFTSKRHLCFWITFAYRRRRCRGTAWLMRQQDAQRALLNTARNHEACLDSGEVPQAATEEPTVSNSRSTNVRILHHGSDPLTSSVHPEWGAGQLTVNLWNKKVVKAASHRRAWSRNSSACCSQLCDSRAAFSYRDLSAYHAPLKFDFDQAPHVTSSVPTELRNAESGTVPRRSSEFQGECPSVLGVCEPPNWCSRLSPSERAEQREKVDPPDVIQRDADVVLDRL